MATSEILVEQGSVIKWTASGGTYAMTLDSLATTAGREGAKGDLGATRAPRYLLRLHIKAGATGPTAGAVYSVYWVDNPGNTTSNLPGLAAGADAAYPASGTIADLRKQLKLVGVLPMASTNNGENQRDFIFSPGARYGQPIVINDTGQTNATGANSSWIELYPIIPQAQ